MRKLLFSVDATAREGNLLYLGGRCYEDVICLGDEFTASLAGSDSALARPVALRVQAILFYGRYINRLDSGHTAELALEILSEATPVVGEVISGRSEEEAFSTIELLGEGDFHVKPV